MPKSSSVYSLHALPPDARSLAPPLPITHPTLSQSLSPTLTSTIILLTLGLVLALTLIQQRAVALPRCHSSLNEMHAPLETGGV